MKKTSMTTTRDDNVIGSSSTEGLPLAPSLAPAMESVGISKHYRLVNRRVFLISLICGILGLVAAGVAEILMLLIGLITNIAFYGRWSFSFTSPVQNHLGLAVIIVPVIGAVLVGIMARYGSEAIRGHGIPEAMEKILLNESRIPARLVLLKPLSAAIAIGTGGPFGAEGPIIATGGSLGSLLGQLIPTSESERRTILAAGAAAGMAATFGSPLSAVLLAIELLLFEFNPRSIIPVAIASAVAASARIAVFGTAAVFEMPNVPSATNAALLSYFLEGAVIGVLAVVITKSVYWIEDTFEKLRIHWMWWPAVGAVAVGIVGYFSPRTLGVGYENITDILSGSMVGRAAVFLCLLKFVSWAISLGSGTSGGTLAPIFTIGGGMGAGLGLLFSTVSPQAGIDIRVAALVGMAGTFAGASRALLASIVFAVETTKQLNALIPLLCGCSMAYLVSALLMRNTIMTEKLARRGHHVPVEYVARQR